jgi:hypothetical protein
MSPRQPVQALPYAWMTSTSPGWIVSSTAERLSGVDERAVRRAVELPEAPPGPVEQPEERPGRIHPMCHFPGSTSEIAEKVDFRALRTPADATDPVPGHVFRA